MPDPRLENQADREVPENIDASDQQPSRAQSEPSECLVNRLAETASFRSDRRRIAEFEKSRPDYGTFLKDEELIELFPEAAENYHVDDIRRAVMMVRMILDYGEAAFSRDQGEAIYILITCILDQEDLWFDGTWCPNNPAARRQEASDCSVQPPGLKFDDVGGLDDDDDDFDWDTDNDERVLPVVSREVAPEAPVHGAGRYRVPDWFEEYSLSVRTPVHDGERRLEHLLATLASGEFRYYTSCFVQPEELHFIRCVGGWLLGLDPAQYTTEAMLNALGDIWGLIRSRGRRDETRTGGQN